jgi:hypothetical protein
VGEGLPQPVATPRRGLPRPRAAAPWARPADGADGARPSPSPGPQLPAPAPALSPRPPGPAHLRRAPRPELRQVGEQQAVVSEARVIKVPVDLGEAGRGGGRRVGPGPGPGGAYLVGDAGRAPAVLPHPAVVAKTSPPRLRRPALRLTEPHPQTPSPPPQASNAPQGGPPPPHQLRRVIVIVHGDDRDARHEAPHALTERGLAAAARAREADLAAAGERWAFDWGLTGV